MSEETKFYYEHQNLRKKVWMDAWTAVAGAFNSKLADPKKWADKALQEFDEQFPSPVLPLNIPEPYYPFPQPMQPFQPFPTAPYPYAPLYVTSDGQFEKWHQETQLGHICTPFYFSDQCTIPNWCWPSAHGFGNASSAVTGEQNIFSNNKNDK